MDFQTIWFFLWGMLWAVYFMLDGFDFGVGILHNFIGKNDTEKRVIINTIGSVWDGNKTWLITAGGATFAAFPTTYALMFSYLYTPLLIILFALILRGAAFEFRGKGESEAWKKGWDVAIFIGSFIPALSFGVVFGNIFQGLAMNAQGYHGTLFTLLNPYGLLTGVLFVLLFIVHGALWLSYKTNGDICALASRIADNAWYLLVTATVLFLAYTAFATNLYSNYISNPIWFIIPVIAVLALLSIKLFTSKVQPQRAFYSSCITILMLIFTGVIGLYPNLIPSSIDPQFSLTIFNSSSSDYTLKIMTIAAFLLVPLVIAYQIWIYRIFRQKVAKEDI